jgi:hypothetical protein
MSFKFQKNVIRKNVIQKNVIRKNVIRKNVIRKNVLRKNVIRKNVILISKERYSINRPRPPTGLGILDEIGRKCHR